MASDTAARKALALELLATGATTKSICAHPGVHCKRHKIRLWKDGDDAFRRKWNELMVELGRDVRDEGEKDGETERVVTRLNR